METDIIYTFSVETEKLEDERVITGLAAPYGEVTRDGRKQAFAPGSFGELDEDVKLNFNHDPNAIIGSVFEAEDTEAGLKIKARIATTPRGEEVYTLLREGHLNKFSVGIVGREFREEGEVTLWTKADLHEVSVVPRPAFKTAAIEAVYSAQADSTNEMEIDSKLMNEEITNKVAEHEERFSDLERKVALFGTQAPVTTEKFASAGEALVALGKGDAQAKQEFAFTGAVLADSNPQPAWIQRGLKLVDEQRNVLNLFDRQALPTSGNFIEYPLVSGVAGTVGVQAAEGDDLPYMEVTLTSATAPVVTYGGYSSVSRQVIDRGDAGYIQTVLDYQARQYAKATNTAVRTALTGATGVNTGTLTVDNAGNWIDLVEDSAALIEDNSKGSSAQFVLMGRSVFKRISHMVDTTGRPLFALNGDGSNTVGSVNPLGARGQIAGLPIVVDPRLTGNNVFVAASDAIVTYEAAGAPFRLQDQNIINLTVDFSLYGYMATAVVNPLAIVKVNATLAA